jgi:hypothetical protein
MRVPAVAHLTGWDGTMWARRWNEGPVKEFLETMDDAVLTGLRVIADRFLSTGRTRLPLCDGDIDHVVGLVHMKDLFNHLKLTPGKLRFVDERTPPPREAPPAEPTPPAERPPAEPGEPVHDDQQIRVRRGFEHVVER